MVKGKRPFLSFLMASIAGLLLTAFFCIARGILSAADQQQVYLIICDGCFATSVLLLGIGLMLLVSNMGTFDILNYGMRTLFARVFRREEKRKSYGSFYDYRVMRESKKAPFGFLLGAGAVFLVAALIFNLLFESIAA